MCLVCSVWVVPCTRYIVPGAVSQVSILCRCRHGREGRGRRGGQGGGEGRGGGGEGGVGAAALLHREGRHTVWGWHTVHSSTCSSTAQTWWKKICQISHIMLEQLFHCSKINWKMLAKRNETIKRISLSLDVCCDSHTLRKHADMQVYLEAGYSDRGGSLGLQDNIPKGAKNNHSLFLCKYDSSKK